MAKVIAARGRSRQQDDDLDEDKLRQFFVEQHARLRTLLRALDATAAAVVRTCQPAPEMREALEKIAQVLTDHMSREERAIGSLLPRTKASGRALHLLHEEHARQLKELESMRRCAACSDDAISLALTVRGFVDDVVLDMDLEDRRYLTSPG